MQVSGIDHVNVLTDDLEATATFYEQVLELVRSENPSIRAGTAGYWMRDAAGAPIIHLVDRTTAPGRYDDHVPGESTNGLHHVALRCTGFDAMRARLDARGIPYRFNDLPHIGLRQLFLADPNAVNLELNFNGD